MTYYFGWALQLGCSGADGGNYCFATNWIMPGGASDEDWLTAQPSHRWRPAAIADLGDLLYPWRWTISAWNVYSKPAGSAVAWTPGTVLSGTTPSAEPWLADLESWMLAEARVCGDPFSLGPEFRRHPNRSLPHALAPLTHLPARLSGEILHLSAHRTWSAAISADYVCLPAEIALSVDGDRVFRLRQGAITPSGDAFIAPYDEVNPPLGTNLVIGGDLVEVRIIVRSAQARDVATLGGRGTVRSNPMSADHVRQAATDNLHPLRLVSAAQPGQAWPPAALNKLVAYALGNGAIGTRDANALSHFPELVIARLELRDLNASQTLQLDNVLQSADALITLFLAELRGVVVKARGVKGLDAEASRLDTLVKALVSDFPKALPALVESASSPSTLLWFGWFMALTKQLLPATATTIGSALQGALADPLRAAGFGQGAWRHRLSAIPGFWSVVMAPDAAQINASLVGHLNIALPLGSSFPQAIVDAGVGGFVEALDLQSAPSAGLLVDPPLQIEFEDSQTGPNYEDIRGYAVALQSGLPASDFLSVEPKASGWVTDVAVWLTTALSSGARWLGADAADDKSWAHETIGATQQGGFRVVSCPFSGGPVNAETSSLQGVVPISARVEAEVTDWFRYLWPVNANHELPDLAYGAFYRATVVALDNAGGQLLPGKIGMTTLALADAFTMPWNVAADERYLSRAAPTAPQLLHAVLDNLPVQATELSEESQAAAYWASIAPDAKQAKLAVYALVAPDSKPYSHPSAESSMPLDVRPPLADKALLARWFAADLLWLGVDTSMLSDDKLKALSSGQLKEVIRQWCEDEQHLHPAVRGLEVAVTFNGGDPGQTLIHRYLLDPFAGADQAGNKPRLDDARIFLEVKATTAASAPGFDGRTIFMPAGTFARLEIRALVPETFLLANTRGQRLNASLLDPAKLVVIEGDPRRFMPFGAAEAWFEALDESWFDPAGKFNDTLLQKWSDTRLRIEEDIPANHVRLGVDAFDAALTRAYRGTTVERHEWHWSGYDVQLPGYDYEAQPPSIDGSLDAWLPSMINAASYRQSYDLPMQSEWNASTRARETPPQTLLVHSGREAGGGRYVSFAVRPQPRFSAWMKREVRDRIQARIAAIGIFLHGRPHSSGERLDPPSWDWSIPLCETFQKNDADVPSDGAQPGRLPRRLANGNLLVFDRAVRRTDDFSGMSGVGEVMDLDVQETRLDNVPEQGVNPIFHAANDTLPDLSFRSSSLFGLTYDEGRNPKVAQTAIVVHPENANGRWVMAKLKARMMVLPETMAGLEVTPGPLALETREQKDQRVPLDFCIDFALGDGLHGITLDWPGGTWSVEFASWLPELERDARYRLVVSWHFGRWGGTGDPDWRAQLLLQRQVPKRLEWTNVKKYSPYGTNSLPPITVPRVDLALTVALGARVTVQRILLSDYTEPRWHTFIGSFGTAIKTPWEYRLVPSDGRVLNMQCLDAGRWESEDKLALQAPATPGALCFQLLLVYRPLDNLMRGLKDATAGKIMSFYVPSGAAAFSIFDALDTSPTQPGDCAYLLSFQRTHTGMTPTALTTWADILQQLFPDDSTAESTVRLLPEYLGPILINT